MNSLHLQQQRELDQPTVATEVIAETGEMIAEEIVVVETAVEVVVTVAVEAEAAINAETVDN